MKKKIICIIIPICICVIVISCLIGRVNAKSSDSDLKTVTSIEINSSLLEKVQKLDPTAKVDSVITDKSNAYYGCIMYKGEKYALYVDNVNNYIKSYSITENIELQNKFNSSNEELLKDDFTKVIDIVIGDYINYNLEWKIVDAGAAVQIYANEVNNGHSTGTTAMAVYDLKGNILSTSFNVAVDLQYSPVDGEIIKQGAIEGIKSYNPDFEFDGSYDAIEYAENVIGGYVYYNVTVDGYLAVVEGWTGKCAFVYMAQ